MASTFRTVFLSFWICNSLLLIGSCSYTDLPPTTVKSTKINPLTDGDTVINFSAFQKKWLAAKAFCKTKQLNESYAIFADLGLHSGFYRCYVVHLPSGKRVDSGLIAHGSGLHGLAIGERKYSNMEGSLLSSLGKYKIAEGYNGRFGLAYKLHGLDSSNAQAWRRAIVLHAHSCVPEKATTLSICQSWGCAMVSPQFLLRLAKMINNSKRPILLWMFDNTSI